jgi:predicted transcriptional regulator
MGATIRPSHSGSIAVVAMTVRTDPELERALATLASAEGVSRQEVIRRAVLERYERASHASRVKESSARMNEQWADVLERLSNA